MQSFYQCLREEPAENIPLSFGVGKNTAALLSLLARLNRHYGTEVGGKNLSMESTAYDALETGRANIVVYCLSKKGRGERVSYTFGALLNQDGRPKIYSVIKTLTNGEFESLIVPKEKSEATAAA